MLTNFNLRYSWTKVKRTEPKEGQIRVRMIYAGNEGGLSSVQDNAAKAY